MQDMSGQQSKLLCVPINFLQYLLQIVCNADFDDEEIGSEDGWDDDLEDSAEAGDDAARANRRRGKGTGNPGKPGKKLRLADLQSQFGVGLKVRWIGRYAHCRSCLVLLSYALHCAFVWQHEKLCNVYCIMHSQAP